jgi:histidinol-phosphate aminotransferase
VVAARCRLRRPARGLQLILGNGSDELIDILLGGLQRPGATVLAPLPSFVMYEMSAALRALQFVGVPLTATSSWTKPRCWRPSTQHRRR